MKTLKTNTKQFKEIISSYLFDALNDIDNELRTKEQVAAYSFARFKSEYNNAYNKSQYPNLQSRLANYLMGLPFDIEFENYKIIELAKKWGTLAPDATDKQEDKITENYWNFMAFHILKFWKANGQDITELY